MMNLSFSNFRKQNPFSWGVWQDALTALFSGLILIVPNIRSLSDNSKHDLSTVWLPILLLITTVLGRFSAPSNNIGGGDTPGPVSRMIIFILILASMFILSSCSLTKKSQTEKSQTGIVSKVDSASLKKNETNSKTDLDWWKETLRFLPNNGRDSFSYTEKTLQPINHFYTQPIEIIREGGTFSQLTNQLNVDSTIRARMDSFYVSQQSKTVTTKTKVLSAGQLILLLFGGLIVWELIKFGMNRISITRK